MTFLRISVTILIFTMVFLARQPAEGVKPLAPLEVTLALGGSPQVGQEVPVVLKVRSLVDAPQVRIECTFPREVELVLGQDTWEGELKAGVVKEIPFTVKVKAPGQHIVRANVTLEYPGGARIVRGAALLIHVTPEISLGIESQKDTSPPKKSPVIEKNEDGEYIGEFTLD